MERFFGVLLNLFFLAIEISCVIGSIGLIIIICNRMEDNLNIIGIPFAVIMAVIGFWLTITDIVSIVKDE
ncbi:MULTISPECIES: hypothetical protein [Clostridium]|uniref:hypothetical protein n=1 Tax=Clostridium TaxID=1485 RepID=UPI00069EE2CF|nr:MULTISPECIES: hypothetical protein [Clostridium]KOF56276.1 hypothetical protein AGR56_05305 [Clostridium sp. DMHC 10]MCD2348268.1 hypothetical protein [Clostridium guangxiense]